MIPRLLRVAGSVLLFTVVLFSCVVWHELLGHALAAELVGGGVDRLVMFGIELFPSPGWVGMRGGFAVIDIVGIEDGTVARSFVTLAGSGSTFLVAVAAVVAIRRFHPRGWTRVVLLAVAWWFLDLLTFTLPSVGLRRGLFFGTTYSEPYEGAVGMGIPGPLFQGAVFVGTALLLAGLYIHRRNEPARRPDMAA